MRELLEHGLATLRRGRDAARDAGTDPAAMVLADDLLNAAVAELDRATATTGRACLCS